MTGKTGTVYLTPNKRLPHYAILALILGIILRIFAIFAAPVHPEADRFPSFNDEASHLNHIQFRMYGDGQPKQRFSATDPQSLVNGEVEYYQPPLYYQLTAILGELHPKSENQLYFFRTVSLLLWLLALYALLLSVRDSHLKGLIVVAGSLVGAGFIPSVTANNDALYALLVAAVYYFSLRNRSSFDLINLSLLVALAIWTKLAALTLIPMVVISCYVFKSDLKNFITRSLVAGFIILWSTFPLWLQRIATYGHPLSLGTGGGENLELPLRELTVAVVLSFIQPWFELWYSPWVKISALLFILFCLIILSYGLYKIRKNNVSIRNDFKKVLFPIWGVGALFGTLGWIYYGIRFNQMETRLLLGAAPGLVLLLGWPVTLMNNRLKSATGWLLTLILAVSFLSWS